MKWLLTDGQDIAGSVNFSKLPAALQTQARSKVS